MIQGKFSRLMAGAVIAVGLLDAGMSQAAVVAYYPLGEGQTNGATAAAPVDSTGNHNFIGGGQIQNPGSITVDTANVAPGTGSTASYHFVASAGPYGVQNVNGSYPLTDNFKVEVWAKSDVANNNGKLISTNGNGSASEGSLQIGIFNSNWVAALSNGLNDGAIFATGPAVSTTAWTDLSVIRLGGTTTFYVNGAPYGTTAAGATVGVGMHFGVTPGGQSGFTGNLDELTVSTVPEPTAVGLLGICAAGLLKRRRKS